MTKANGYDDTHVKKMLDALFGSNPSAEDLLEYKKFLDSGRKTNKKGGKVKASKYAKGGGVRKSKYSL